MSDVFSDPGLGNRTKDEIQRDITQRDVLRKAMWTWLIGTLMVLAISVLINMLLVYAMVWRFPIRQFVWTANAQAVCEATPLTEPNISQAAIKNLASTVGVQLNSYDYANWKININDVIERYFTPNGRDQYRKVISNTGIIRQVVNNYQVVSAVTIGPPTITTEGRDSKSRYYWDVDVPITIFYQTNIETKKENRLLTMTIVRVEPSLYNPNGVAIDAVVSKQLTTQKLNEIAR